MKRVGVTAYISAEEQEVRFDSEEMFTDALDNFTLSGTSVIMKI